MEKSPVQRNGQSRYFEGSGQAQEITRTIRIFNTEHRDEFLEVAMLGHKWRGRNNHTFWHVVEVKSVRGKVWGTTVYRYRYMEDIHDPYWGGYPNFYDLEKVNEDGTVEHVGATTSLAAFLYS